MTCEPNSKPLPEWFNVNWRMGWDDHWRLGALYYWGLGRHSVLMGCWYPREPMWVTFNRPGYEKIGEILRSGD